DDTYTIAYTLSGSNTGTQSVALTIAGGIGNITLPAASIPNAGTTTITFNTIVSDSNLCGMVLSNVGTSFTLNPIADMEDAHLTILPSCLGADIVVTISGATGLPNGNYEFNYTIPQFSPGTGTTGTIVITGGAGQFTIPAATFAAAGNYSIIIDGIVNLITGCNNLNENATATFAVLALPNVTGAVMSAPAICIGQHNTVTISGASVLADGTYSITYQLSGASTA